MLKFRENFAAYNHWKVTPGFMAEEEAELLYRLAQETYGNILEVGSLYGKSSGVLALARPKAKLFCIDPWTFNNETLGEYVKYLTPYKNVIASFMEFKNNIKNIRNIYPIPSTLEDAMPLLTSVKFGLIFIDANHEYEFVKKDIELALKLNPTVVALHDYDAQNWVGVYLAAKDVFTHPPDYQAGSVAAWEIRK